MSDADKFVLRSTVTSPFGRKVRMAIDILGLADRIKLEPADPLNESDTLRQQNPLALGYLDWRKQVDWRPAYPGLVAWLNAFSAHEPAFERTRAPDA
jgi:glutathione S-transferase